MDIKEIELSDQLDDTLIDENNKEIFRGTGITSDILYNSQTNENTLSIKALIKN